MQFSKRGRRIFFVFILLISASVKAQLHERIYIQTDRNSYVAGETLWFKVYMLNSLTPGSTSTNLLVDLVDQSGNRISSGSLPISGATAAGHLELPSRLQQGIYILRTYTATKQDKNRYFSAVRHIYLFNPDNKGNSGRPDEVICRLFPAATDWVTGLDNLVYADVRDAMGHPAIAEAVITNASGTESSRFTTDSSGKTRFMITPSPGETYVMNIRLADGAVSKTVIPAAAEQKVLLTMREEKNARLFVVQIPPALQKGQALTVRGFMDDNLVFARKFNAISAQVSARIPVNELPAGLLQLMVNNENGQKLGEAVSLILPDSSFLPVTFITDTVGLSPNAQNVYTLRIPEGTAGSFSVSVTDADKNFNAEENNIITGLLLNQDSRENTFVNNIDITSPAARNKLDLLMGTTRWRDQSEYLNDTLVVNDTGFITVSGKIIDKGKNKPLEKGDLNFVYTTSDSLTAYQYASVDKTGHFVLPQLIFEGSQLIRYALNGDKWKELAAEIDTTRMEDRFPLPFRKTEYIADRSVFADEILAKQVQQKRTELLSDSVSATGLKEVVVVARTVPPKQQVNDRYTRGMFNSMANAKVLDLINEPGIATGTILDYLIGKIPGLMIRASGNDYVVEANRVLSFNMMPPVRLFLNESITTVDFLKSIWAKDVALVKYYPPGMGGGIPNVGIGAALVIYTRKNADDNGSGIGGMNSFRIQGYMPSRDFVKDYLQKNSLSVSNRPTVYWNPYLVPEESGTAYKIRFTNAASAKTLKVVIEGFTIDGKLLHFEKIIQ